MGKKPAKANQGIVKIEVSADRIDEFRKIMVSADELVLFTLKQREAKVGQIKAKLRDSNIPKDAQIAAAALLSARETIDTKTFRTDEYIDNLLNLDEQLHSCGGEAIAWPCCDDSPLFDIKYAQPPQSGAVRDLIRPIVAPPEHHSLRLYIGRLPQAPELEFDNLGIGYINVEDHRWVDVTAVEQAALQLLSPIPDTADENQIMIGQWLDNPAPVVVGNLELSRLTGKLPGSFIRQEIREVYARLMPPESKSLIE